MAGNASLLDSPGEAVGLTSALNAAHNKHLIFPVVAGRGRGESVPGLADVHVPIRRRTKLRSLTAGAPAWSLRSLASRRAALLQEDAITEHHKLAEAVDDFSTKRGMLKTHVAIAVLQLAAELRRAIRRVVVANEYLVRDFLFSEALHQTVRVAQRLLIVDGDRYAYRALNHFLLWLFGGTLKERDAAISLNFAAYR